MSSAHDRLAECERRNGGHLEDVIFRVEWWVVCFFVLCYVSRPLLHLLLQMLKYVLPYKCNCIMISNTFNFFKHLKIARFAGGPCIFFYITQMSLTWITETLTAYAFFIGEIWDGRDVGGSVCGLSDLLHQSSAWCCSWTRTCEKTRACYVERNCWEGRLFANICGLGCSCVLWRNAVQ